MAILPPQPPLHDNISALYFFKCNGGEVLFCLQQTGVDWTWVHSFRYMRIQWMQHRSNFWNSFRVIARVIVHGIATVARVDYIALQCVANAADRHA
jgi:hypothetical protein